MCIGYKLCLVFLQGVHSIMFCSLKYLTSRIEVHGEVYVGLYVKCLLLLSYVTTTGGATDFGKISQYQISLKPVQRFSI